MRWTFGKTLPAPATMVEDGCPRPASPRHRKRLSRDASFTVAAAVVAHTLWTSAAPAMTYPLYASQWRLTPTSTTAVFAVYPIVVVVVLLAFGDLSDHIGRRATMLLGLAASFVGVLLFVVAPNVGWILIGRCFMGVGVGLSATPATAALIEFCPPVRAGLASTVTTLAQSAGLALALLLGGGLIQYAPFPMRLDFIVLLVVVAAIAAVAWFLPHHTDAETTGRWRPRLPFVPRGLRRTFAAAVAAVSCAYALGALILALGAQIAHDLIGSGNALVSGAVLSSFALASGTVALAGRGLSFRTGIVAGGAASTLAMTLLATAASRHSSIIFLPAIMLAGVGYSMLFLGGLTLINATAPAHHRGATLSALYLVAYLSQGVVALSLGWVATAWTLAVATDIGAMAIGSLCALAIGLALAVPETWSAG